MITSSYLNELQTVLAAMHPQAPAFDAVCETIAQAVLAGHTLYACGNGGSATDAMHLTQELVGRYRSNRRPLPAVCLNSDVGALTCIGNDFGYEQVFARQLRGLAHPGDVLVVFSTSGNSPNICAALHAAHDMGVLSVALLGKGGGDAAPLADHRIVVPSDSTARIQEAHTLLLHAICESLEQHTAPPAPPPERQP